MEEANIISQMDSFDFTKPLNVTTVFEDSEDYNILLPNINSHLPKFWTNTLTGSTHSEKLVGSMQVLETNNNMDHNLYTTISRNVSETGKESSPNTNDSHLYSVESKPNHSLLNAKRLALENREFTERIKHLQSQNKLNNLVTVEDSAKNCKDAQPPNKKSKPSLPFLPESNTSHIRQYTENMTYLQSPLETNSNLNDPTNKAVDQKTNKISRSTKKTSKLRQPLLLQPNRNEQKCTENTTIIDSNKSMNTNKDLSHIINELETIISETTNEAYSENNINTDQSQLLQLLTKSCKNTVNSNNMIEQQNKKVCMEYTKAFDTPLDINGDNVYYENTENSSVKSNLLKIISEHLIMIMEAHDCYMNVFYNRNNELDIIQREKHFFYRRLIHFFDLSYSTTVALLIPEEKNNTFISNFLNATINLAKDTKGKTYSYRDVEKLYFDMLKWTKEKQTRLYSSLSLQCSTSALKDQLNKPLNYPPYPVQMNSQIVNKCIQPLNKTIVISTGTPGTEVVINYDQSLLNKHSSLENPPENSCSYNNSRESFQDYFAHNHKNPMLPDNVINNYKQQAMFNYQIRQERHLQNNNNNHDSAHNSKDYTVYNQPNDFGTRISTNRFSQNGHNRCRNNEDRLISGETTRSPVYITNGAMYNKHYNGNTQISASQNISSPPAGKPIQYNENHPTEYNRSSVSTDSGIMSPLNLNPLTHADQMDATTSVEEQSPLIITHVTSLHSKAPQIIVGNCHVCGKTTRNKCLGCYRSYYCGYDCQKSDWKHHMNYCTPFNKI